MTSWPPGRSMDRARDMTRRILASWLQAGPLALILSAFLLLPLLVILVVSFYDYDSVQVIPAFVLTNYADVLGSAVTWRTYLNTIRFTLVVWAITAVLG